MDMSIYLSLSVYFLNYVRMSVYSEVSFYLSFYGKLCNILNSSSFTEELFFGHLYVLKFGHAIWKAKSRRDCFHYNCHFCHVVALHGFNKLKIQDRFQM